MFDTHCHLNFKTFVNNVDEVISNAENNGVMLFVVPGTDEVTSVKAVELATKYDGVYGACGVHPHHVYERIENGEMITQEVVDKSLLFLMPLLACPKVVAVGEIGLDKHYYAQTKYKSYAVEESFIKAQQLYVIAQLKSAFDYKKSVIIHNREATDETLELLKEHWDSQFENRLVIHCCEPSERFLEFTKSHNVFIGVDGDVTYDTQKQEFIKKIPLDRLVVETDSPFIVPEPLKSQKVRPNTPSNLRVIIECVAKLKGESVGDVIDQTTKNGKELFQIG